MGLLYLYTLMQGTMNIKFTIFLCTRSDRPTDRPQTLLYVTPYTKFHTKRSIGLGVHTRTAWK